MAEVLQFLRSIFWRWQGWTGGSGVGGAVVVFITIWQQLGHTISRGMYISIVVTGFLIGACFLAWRDQYRARLKAEKSHYDGRPQLMLSTTDQKAQIWLKGQLAFIFSFQNCGQRAARFSKTLGPPPRSPRPHRRGRTTRARKERDYAIGK